MQAGTHARMHIHVACNVLSRATPHCTFLDPPSRTTVQQSSRRFFALVVPIAGPSTCMSGRDTRTVISGLAYNGRRPGESWTTKPERCSRRNSIVASARGIYFLGPLLREELLCFGAERIWDVRMTKDGVKYWRNW